MPKPIPSDTRFFGSAKLIALCTLGSRITGLARDIVINSAFGQGWVQDAFNYGFQVPNLFRRLFGEGALSAVFVPVFTEVLDRDGRPAAWTLLGRVAGLMTLVLTVLVVLIEGIVLTVYFVAPGESMRLLQMGLTALMMPFMVSVCLLALFSSILNCIRHFTVPALLPIVLNVMQIVGVYAIAPLLGTPEQLERRVYGVAIAVLLTGVLQIVLILPVLKRNGVTFRMSLDTADPQMRRIMRSFVPILLGQGILLFNVFFDAQLCTFLTRGPNDPAELHILGTTVAYPLKQGALSAVTNAQRLYQFPLGVLAISLATAAFPMFSLYASRGEMEGLRSTVGRSMRMAMYEGLPSGLMLILLAEPIIALLFERGRFGPEQTLRAAWVLKWYGIGMAAFCSQQIVLRVFYSLKDTMTPMWVACSLAVVNAAINVTLVWNHTLAEAAFGLSTSATAIANVAISVWLLRQRMGGRMGARAILGGMARTALCTVAAGVAAWLLLRAVSPWSLAQIEHHRPDLSVYGKAVRLALKGVRVAVPLGGAMVAFFAVSRALGMEEFGWIFRRERGKRSDPADVAEAAEEPPPAV